MKATREAFGNHLPIMGNNYDDIVALDAAALLCDISKLTTLLSSSALLTGEPLVIYVTG